MKKIVLFSATAVILLLVACKPAQKPVVRMKEQPQNNIPLKEVFLKVFGTEPFWNVEIAEDQIIYKDMEGKLLSFPYKAAVEDVANATKTYQVMKDGIELYVQVKENYCSDGMSDNDYSYQAKIQIKDKGKLITEHNGCARYVLHPALGGRWNLKELNSVKVKEDGSYAAPYLEFDATENRVFGNSSCNGFNGQVFSEGKTLKFSHMAVTLMMCMNENIEREFLDALNQINRFEIEGTEYHPLANENVLNTYG